MTEPTKPTATAAPKPARQSDMAAYLTSPLAYALAICMVLIVVTAGIVAISKEHRSALEICTDNGGSYEVYAKTCTLPAGRPAPRTHR